MRFTKMHGLGNDYVYVNGFEERVTDAPSLARAMSDRRTGVGSDGLILVCPSRVADVRMEMYNADGSRGRMCGNGLRCVAKLACDCDLLGTRVAPPDSANESPQDARWTRAMHHLARTCDQTGVAPLPDARAVGLIVETDAGVLPAAVLKIDRRVAHVCADVGRPVLAPEAIPSTIRADRVINHPLTVGGEAYRVTCVSMGSPHVVIPVDDPEAVDLETVGPLLENAPEFPDRINVHFACVLSRDAIRIRTWERGSGITHACGTGAAAACVACAVTDRTDRSVDVHMPGGTLAITWDQDDHVYMTGPAVEVFTGQWDPR